MSLDIHLIRKQESTVLLGALAAMPHVRLFGSPASRTPMAYFRVAGHTPQQVAAYLAARGVNAQRLFEKPERAFNLSP